MSIRSEFVRLWNEFMASAKKISELPSLPSPVANSDLFEVVRGGANYKGLGSQLPSGGGGGSVVSVTGDFVDNTDPTNPVVTGLQAALDLKESLYRPFDRKTSNYPLVLADASRGIEMNMAGANTVTVPLNATQAFPVGTLIPVVQYGAGLTSVVATGGVTINTSAGNLDSPGQYAPMFLRKIATNEWYLWNGTAGGGGGAGTVTSVGWTGGIVSIANPTTTPALTIAGTSGGVPYFNSASTWATSGALAANALVIGGGAGSAPATTTTGTGVVTALGVNVGSSGAVVVNGGALGTPSGGTLTNATGLPIATGVSGLGADVATFLATPSSANLAAAVTDEVGAGSLVLSEPDVNTQTGSYTLVLTDKAKEVRMNVAGSNNLTVPLNSSVAFPTGTLIVLSQYGAGVTTVVATGGVTIRSSSGNLLSPGQYSPMVLRKIGTDEWYLWNGASVATGAFTRTNGTYITITLSGSMSAALNTAVDILAELTGVVPLTLGGTGASSATQTYTPTLTNTANVAASTARLCTYMRVGNVVTVAGQLDIDPTTTLTATTLGISLPIASAFTTAFQLGGTASAIGVTDSPAGIQADATNDRAVLQYICTDVTNHTMTFQFTYQVL